MEINPYQAPRAGDRADVEAIALPQRSPADRPLGACYFFIAWTGFALLTLPWLATIAYELTR